MGWIDKVTSFLENAIDKSKSVAQTLPPLLLYCTAINRSGISASRAAANAISRCREVGIPTDIMPDGSPNLINQYTYILTKAVFKEIKENGVVQICLPTGSLMIQTNGGNAGGPVVSVGTNITNTIAKGLFR
jgi:hypothetical protein